MFFLGAGSPHNPKFLDYEVSPSKQLVFVDRLVICLNGHRNMEWETQREWSLALMGVVGPCICDDS